MDFPMFFHLRSAMESLRVDLKFHQKMCQKWCQKGMDLLPPNCMDFLQTK